ncbi:GTPase SAR1 and related small G proteins [Prochlorococcus marinus str. MIT 9515]|uniref:GTPase SAR1 and related small G proteins n=1 Tax=Prochlorococcus marinus (strain MIT 9515) TaxID=167542 RepID=A2BWP5_PROM5|nr:GTP-binding protein [Prochlorococcus marinus]ABM72206.1 GTPase SAR1 and related small G proteins [Prochlorococcus marinus str. MIT 9515]
MYKFIFKYYKYLFILIFIYFLLSLLRNIFNLYFFMILLIILSYFYNKNKKVFKKVVYKIIFNNKKNIPFKNNYGAAINILESIEEINKKISNKVESELLIYEKNKLTEQLKYGDYNVILFGAGSSGKTSIARALLKNLIGKISPTIGTTKNIASYKIRIPILKRNINIIDTPGLFEASIDGEKREKSTIIEASKSDLILFVLDQDINKFELYLIRELLELRKKIIIVLNKCDLRSEKQNNNIKENIISMTSSKKIKISVVKTIASNNLSPNHSLGSIDVSNLFKEVIETLDENGEELLADNILFRCNKLGLISKKVISEQRESSAIRVINKYTWITGGVILVNPLPVVDFITTTSVNVQMILEISKIYNVRLSKIEAVDLSKSLITTLAKLGILKGGLNVITTALSSNFTTIYISKSIQSLTSCWLIKIVGLSIIEYFKNGQNWGDAGIQEVIDDIYKLNKREQFLNKFIKEAINKINIKEDNQSQRKLPPYFQKD